MLPFEFFKVNNSGSQIGSHSDIIVFGNHCYVFSKSKLFSKVDVFIDEIVSLYKVLIIDALILCERSYREEIHTDCGEYVTCSILEDNIDFHHDPKYKTWFWKDYRAITGRCYLFIINDLLVYWY